MDDLVERVEKGLIGDESVRRELAARYRNLCGDYGGGVFETSVLPAIMRYYKNSPVKAVIRALGVIETAADCRPDTIRAYLLSVRIPANGSVSQSVPRVPLEEYLRRLRRWVVIFNKGL